MRKEVLFEKKPELEMRRKQLLWWLLINMEEASMIRSFELQKVSKDLSSNVLVAVLTLEKAFGIQTRKKLEREERK